MPRQKKEGTYLNCKIETSIAKRLEDYCKETGLTKTITVEKALNAYLVETEKKRIKQI